MILYLVSTAEVTPANAGLVSILKRMNPASYKVLVAYGEGELIEHLNRNSISYDVIPGIDALRNLNNNFLTRYANFSLEVFRYYRKLVRYFRMYPFEIVHSFDFKSNMLSVMLKVLFNVTLLWQFSEILNSKFKLKAFRVCAGVFSDHLFAISQSVARQLGRSLHWRDKVSVVYRGYLEKNFSAKSGTNIGFVYTGEIWFQNSEKVFLRAIELLRRNTMLASHHGVILVPVSLNNAAKEQLLKMIDDFHLSDFVSVEEVACFYADGAISNALKVRGVGVLVHSSLEFEPFASDVIECMASGIAVVGGRCGVISELILHGDTGILANAGDSQAIAHAIQELMADNKNREIILSTARKEFEGRFNFEKYLAEISKVYSNYIDLETVFCAFEEVKKAA